MRQVSDESLVEIYRAGDIAQATFLKSLLEERNIPVFDQEASMDGLPRVYFGTLAYRIMICRADAEAHAGAIAEAIREFEQTMGLGPENKP